nr:MAG TPA: hypothetical protein [Caudoviricetes sp.]
MAGVPFSSSGTPAFLLNDNLMRWVRGHTRGYRPRR